MNERTNELAEQAEEHANLEWPNPNHKEQWKNCRNNYFAELIRADERDKCAQDYLQDCCDAVEAARLDEREQISHTYLKLTLEAVIREREANAKLCEGLSGRSYEYDMGRLHSAAAIRARSNHETT